MTDTYAAASTSFNSRNRGKLWTRCAVLSTTAAALSAFAVPAASAAATVFTTRFAFEDTFVTQPGDPASCSFPTYADFQVKGTFQFRTDAQGQPVSATIEQVWAGTISANGKSIVERAAQIETYDLGTGASANIGQIHDMSLPGGLLIHDVGILIFDAEGNLTFEAGPHEGLEGDQTAIASACGALT